MASELSKKESHSFIKRAAVIVISLLVILISTYLISSSVVLGQYKPTMDEIVGKVYANSERDLAFFFNSSSTSMSIISGKNQVCETSIKENVVYVTKVDPEIYLELVIISPTTIFCNQYSQYLHLLEAAS